MSRSEFPWLVVGGAVAAIAYLVMRRSDHGDVADELEPGTPHELELRNASLNYRPVGHPGEPYPAWVRALRGESGVYVIRERQRDGSNPVVYVGESHSARLQQTLARHFQTWRRSKKFWSGQYGGQGHDPGLTYDRARVTVAARVMSPERAIEEEARLIARLRPRDNLLGQPADLDDEAAPF
jgi:hypothetical protein